MRSSVGLLVGCWRTLACTATAPPALLTFDFTGTLAGLRAGPGKLYKESLLAAAATTSLRAEAAELNEAALDRAFRTAYGEAEKQRPCFGAGVCSSEAWWYEVVEQTFALAGLRSAAADCLLPDTFDALYRRVFASEAAWELRPHAAAALEHVGRWRGADGARVKLGVVSNWDDRLPQVCAPHAARAP